MKWKWQRFWYIPLLDWKRDSAENGCGADDVTATLVETGGKGVAKSGGGNDECAVVAEYADDTDAIEPGGGVGFVIVFVTTGDNCALLALKIWNNSHVNINNPRMFFLFLFILMTIALNKAKFSFESNTTICINFDFNLENVIRLTRINAHDQSNWEKFKCCNKWINIFLTSPQYQDR